MTRLSRDRMDNKIDVVIVEKGIGPYEARIERTNKEMRKIVGGYLEEYFIHYAEDGGRMAIVLDDESKMKGKPLNRILIDEYGNVLDTIHGEQFLIVSYDSAGHNQSLTQEQITEYVKMFMPPVVQI